MYHRPASFLMAVFRARHSDSLVAILDPAVHGRSVRSAHFLSQINFRTIRAREPRNVRKLI
jgi:hypothetical protein